jgi:Cu2+-exporting ATPase
MYISMGNMMWGWPVPAYFEGNHMALGILQMLLTSGIMVINQKFFVSGVRGLLNFTPNMDTLVALGAGAAYGYSVYALIRMSTDMMYAHEMYFESAGMILTLITVGKMLEARSKGRTTDALKSLMKLAPDKATVVRNEQELVISASQVVIGDTFLVKAGERVPVDGVITEGISAIDESALTGESVPVDKGPGDRVSAATINKSGFIRCEATGVGEDTTLAKIIKLVEEGASSKAPIAKVADKVSGVFVPVVIGIALVTIAVWLISGAGVGYALARGISVLVISCPCALGLATPVAIMVGSGQGAKRGILYKTAVSLEETGKTDWVILDKTGTITQGSMAVTDVVAESGVTEESLIKLGAALERRSEHPVAQAVVEYYDKVDFSSDAADDVTDFMTLPGNGVTARLGEHILCGGSMSFMSNQVDISSEMMEAWEHLAMEGKTPLFFSMDDQLLGIIAVADTLKEDSIEAISELKKLGTKVVMLTGDNEKTAQAVGKEVGVDEIVAGVLPDGKEKVVREYKERGKVIMVGDGINDAPALTVADVGIAIGAGTDVAIDAADVVLMNSKMMDVVTAIQLSRKTLRNIHENLFWAFIYNVLGIPLAAGIWIPILGWQLSPMFAAAAMSLSSFCVVTNALRLNGFKSIADRQPAPITIDTDNNNIEEEDTMKRKMEIEGMMCAHCEATVKATLEAIPGVESAKVSHKKGTAVVKADDSVTNETLKKAVEDKDYKVKSVG